MKNYLDISPEVAAALAENRPVVALESTIISHGMPYPQNVQTALEVEATVRASGATPATIAIIDGRLKAGLSVDEIEQLGQAGHAVAKVSRRDLPFIIAKQAMGATTVATTMMIAHMAGIKVFATGGIGGAHRGAQTSFDVSADLQELARTPVAVVCAGAKSILDLGLTLEYLETHGVPVVGYQTALLPAFFTRDSAFKVDYQLDSAAQIAQAMHAARALNLSAGMVIANPIPEQYAMPTASIDAAIDQALREADEQQILGKQATPFLLARVCELTGGDSLSSNIQLVLNNARLASAIAVAYCAG
ncbi:MAG: pseudouridine-5'-phosphate glycosidase [Formosimonas sp.]